MALPTINLGGSNLPPEILGQQQALNRQQQMAQMLMQQGQQMPTGQMVSGRYVAPSFFQYAAPLFQTYAGKSLAEKGDKQALELAAALRKRYGDELSEYQNLVNPRQTEMAGPTPTGAPLMSNPPDRQAANLFAASAYNPALQAVGMKNLTQGPKWEKASFTDEKTGKTREGVIDVNSPDPISTFQVGGVKPEMSAYERASLNLKVGDQAISRANLQFNTGMTVGGGGVPMGAPMGNAPAGAPMNAPTGVPMAAPTGNVPVAGGMPISNAPAQQMNNAVPNTQSQYVNNPALSPKANQELAVKFYADLDKNVKNARDSFSVIKDAADIFNTGRPTSGGFQNIGTGVAEFFNIPTQAADADAQLTILGEKLTAQVPRFEGPQSDKDTEAYRAAAGNLGNSNKTISSRMSALRTLIDLNKKYYPQGNWDSIDLAGPVTTKQTFFKGKQTIDPVTFSQGLNAQDKEAFNWARKNPTDPRAAQINQRLGIR
jgi:hypothetical protein